MNAEPTTEQVTKDNPHGTAWRETGRQSCTGGTLGPYDAIHYISAEKWECSYVRFHTGRFAPVGWMLGAN